MVSPELGRELGRAERSAGLQRILIVAQFWLPQTEDDFRDVPHLLKLRGIQSKRDLDMVVGLSQDLECKASAAQFDQPQGKVANEAFVVRLDVAASTIGHLKLPLDQQVRTFHIVRIEILFVRFLGTEPELKVVAGGRGGYTLCVESH